MECLSSVASAIVPLVSNTIFRHVAYPFTATTNITVLIRSVAVELADKRQDAVTKISNAERENGAPTAQAMRWLQEVEAIEQKAKEIQQNYQKLPRCLCDISPDLCSIYKISRRAAKTQVEVRRLCDRIETMEVIVRMPPPLQEMPDSSSKAYNDSQDIKKIGPCGGYGGGARNMNINGVSRILAITVRHDVAIDAIKVDFLRNDHEESTERWGGEGGGEIKFHLGPDEYITSVKGYIGDYGGYTIVKSLKFETNFSSFGLYGREEGMPFELSAPNGQIIGFHAHSGLFLDAIGVYVKGL